MPARCKAPAPLLRDVYVICIYDNYIAGMTAWNILCLLWLTSTVGAVTHTVMIKARSNDNQLKIDPCVQLNDRGETILRDTWYHRRTPALWVDGLDTTYNSGTTPPSAYNFYSLYAVGTHTGVKLEICEPDFAIMRDEQRDECYPSTVHEPVSYTHLTLPTIYSV